MIPPSTGKHARLVPPRFVGLSFHRSMKAKQQTVQLCLRIHLCTIMSPTYLTDLRRDSPP